MVNNPASARLTRGPTTAIRKSAPGVAASASICDTPPKMNSVIRRTGILYRRAMTEWPSSCSTTLTKSMTAVTAPTIQ
jgi:hypothetical protein